MNSLIIVSKNAGLVSDYLDKFFSGLKIENIDRDSNIFEKTVGIPDIREIQKKIYLKPIKSKDKAVILNAPEGLTAEAQNALLKILEEPPENTFILLIVTSQTLLLPTVLSRCKVIELKEERVDKDLGDTNDILNQLSTAGVGEKLKLAQAYSKTKDEAIVFLENLIIAERKRLLGNPSDKITLKILKDFQKTHTIIKSTNATPRLTLENLLLNL